MTDRYKKDFSKHHSPLTRKEQIILYNKIQNGDTDARDKVIYSCLPLVIGIAKKFRSNNKHIDLDDMVQEGNIALMKAVDKWDVSKGTITTVATWYVRTALIDMITDAKYTIKQPYSLSRRAAEELRRIKNVDSNDINYISQQTGLTPKRVRKLLAVSPRGIRRALYQSNSREWERRTDFTNHPNFPIYSAESEDEERPSKPCMADLISLININLKGDQKTIFLLWAGINAKKIGPKEIARSLGKTEKYVYDNIYSAKRILSKAAKEVSRHA
jgi:RNA polymerase sigma factor (sigma-70 family)